MKLNIKPTYKLKEETILVEAPLKVRIEEDIEDYITGVNDDES